MKEFLSEKIHNADLVEAILKEKYCDAHVHFERICNSNSTEGYSTEYFNSDFFAYVDIMERPERYLSCSKYEEWLSNVIFLNFYIFFNKKLNIFLKF
jgi:hypothetical protein